MLWVLHVLLSPLQPMVGSQSGVSGPTRRVPWLATYKPPRWCPGTEPAPTRRHGEEAQTVQGCMRNLGLLTVSSVHAQVRFYSFIVTADESMESVKHNVKIILQSLFLWSRETKGYYRKVYESNRNVLCGYSYLKWITLHELIQMRCF